MSNKKEDRSYFKKIDLSSFKKYGKQEEELNKLLKAVKDAENFKDEVKAKISLRKYLKKTKECE